MYRFESEVQFNPALNIAKTLPPIIRKMRDKKLEKLSETILEIINLTKNEVKDTEFNYNDYIFTSFLKRHIYILYGIYELIPKYIENNNLIIVISPLLRMGITDFISQCYLLSAIKSENDIDFYKAEYENRVERILYSPIIKEMKRIEKQKQSGIISPEKYKTDIAQAYTVAKVAFSKFNIETSEYELKIKNDISPAKMFRISTENQKFKQYHAAYDLYDYYSKIEHFGGFSNLINGIEYKNEKVNIDRLIHSIIFISKGVEFCIQNIESEKKSKILKDLQKVAKNFLDKPLNKNWW